MSDTLNMDNFVGLSAVMTGFSATKFAPSLDPVDIKSTYIKVWSAKVDVEAKQKGLAASILSNYASLRAQTPALSDQEIGEQLLANNAQEIPCRKLIYLWYMGAWPTVKAEPGNAAGTNGNTSFETISSKSYTSGLVWQVMQSHPMGDSNYRYGYWSTAPATLDNYTGNGESS
ncbi:MAG: hypothetical protein JKX98_09145 [Alcanivoracaceae bacterium]|nr:hypothetical protein [Alcanivoracaceae bacterium]